MKIKYNKKNPVEKKKLIVAVCEITGATSKYMGPPTMRYQIGELVVDRDGNLVVADGEDVTWLLEALRERGYEGEVEMTVQVSGGQMTMPSPALCGNTVPCGNTGFTISLPKSKLPADAMKKMDKGLSLMPPTSRHERAFGGRRVGPSERMDNKYEKKILFSLWKQPECAANERTVPRCKSTQTKRSRGSKRRWKPCWTGAVFFMTRAKYGSPTSGSTRCSIRWRY